MGNCILSHWSWLAATSTRLSMLALLLAASNACWRRLLRPWQMCMPAPTEKLPALKASGYWPSGCQTVCWKQLLPCVTASSMLVVHMCMLVKSAAPLSHMSASVWWRCWLECCLGSMSRMPAGWVLSTACTAATVTPVLQPHLIGHMPAIPGWKMATMSPLLSCTQAENPLMGPVQEGDQHLSDGWGLPCSLQTSVPELQPTKQLESSLAAGSGGWL